jgi:uncharacterized membrane protein YraQ (UPF0718 family)
MNWISEILMQLWGTLQDMAPYLLFGFAVAGLLSVVISPATVERHLGGHGFGSVLRAALVGVPLPLCSCSVIPVTLTLRRHGAGRGAATAFLLSTPQTGVDSIMVTYALLGPVLAVYRPLTAFLTGVFGGALTNALTRHEPDILPETPAAACKGCCGKHTKQPHFLLRALRHGFVTLPADAGASMLAGLLIAGLIAALVPETLFDGALGNGIPGMLAMMLFGIPVYVCATASVPIAAALILKGVSPGVALVFLMTGPATNAAAIAAVWKMMGRRTALIYLATTACTALAAGLLLDLLLEVTPLSIPVPCHTGRADPLLPSLFAVALIVVLLVPTLRRGYRTWLLPLALRLSKQ